MVTLGLNQKDRANDYLLKLQKDNIEGFRSIFNRLRAVSEHETFENKLTYRHVGDGIFAAIGGKKGNKKEQNADIKKANDLKDQYNIAKEQVTTTLEIILLPDEH